MRELINKIRMILKKGLVTLKRSDAKGQCSYLGKTSNYESIKPYGFDSRPIPNETLVALLSLNANESNKLGIEYANNNLFETESLAQGEAVVYNPFNQNSYVIFKRDGTAKLVGDKIAIGNTTTELLDQLSQEIQAIIVHTHASILGETATPSNAATFTSIKNKIDVLKGSI